MRRALASLLLILSAGCVSMPWSQSGPETGPPPAPLRQQRDPVAPEQVTPNNAHAVSQALWDELDRVVATPIFTAGCPHCQGKNR